MQGIVAEILLIQSDGQSDAEGVSVFEGHGALDARDIGGGADVIIGCLHRRLQLCEDLRIIAAEADLGLIVSHQLVACARAADGVQRQSFVVFRKARSPRIGIG